MGNSSHYPCNFMSCYFYSALVHFTIIAILHIKSNKSPYQEQTAWSRTLYPKYSLAYSESAPCQVRSPLLQILYCSYITNQIWLDFHVTKKILNSKPIAPLEYSQLQCHSLFFNLSRESLVFARDKVQGNFINFRNPFLQRLLLC